MGDCFKRGFVRIRDKFRQITSGGMTIKPCLLRRTESHLARDSNFPLLGELAGKYNDCQSDHLGILGVARKDHMHLFLSPIGRGIFLLAAGMLVSCRRAETGRSRMRFSASKCRCAGGTVLFPSGP